MHKFHLMYWFSVGMFIAGALAGLLLEDLQSVGVDELVLVKDPYINSTLLIILIFIASSLFGGYGSFLILLLAGMYVGNNVSQAPDLLQGLGAGVLSIPYLVSGYAGILLGYSSKRDLEGKSNLKVYVKSIALMLSISVLSALVLIYLGGVAGAVLIP